MNASEIKQMIEAALPGSIAEVEDYTGTGDHFQATVTASQFEGLGLVQQHQLVYAPLRDHMASQAIHALALHTRTP